MPRLNMSNHSPDAIRAQLRQKTLGMSNQEEEVNNVPTEVNHRANQEADRTSKPDVSIHDQAQAQEILPPTVIDGVYTAHNVDTPSGTPQHAFSDEEDPDKDPFEPENNISTTSIEALRQSRFREQSLEQSAGRERQMTPGPLREFNSEQAGTMGALFEQLTRNLPLNDFGLPNYIYRTDLIDIAAVRDAIDIIKLASKSKAPTKAPPSNDLLSGVNFKSAGSDLAKKIDARHEDKKDELKEKTNSALKMLASAQLPLSYHEGFPTLPDGMPMWAQLPAEPNECYHAFTEYMELPGNRHVHLLTSFPIDDLLQWMHMYYWTFRCKAFDLYRVAHAQKLRQHRLLNVEDSHYNIADKMVKTLRTALENISMEDLDNLAPAEKILLMEKAIKLQRLALGLPANGGPMPEDARKVTPPSVLIQQINQPGVVSNVREGVDSYTSLHEDPDMLEKAQELILHMNGYDIGSHLPQEPIQKLPMFKDKVSKRSDGK